MNKFRRRLRKLPSNATYAVMIGLNFLIVGLQIISIWQDASILFTIAIIAEILIWIFAVIGIIQTVSDDNSKAEVDSKQVQSAKQVQVEQAQSKQDYHHFSETKDLSSWDKIIEEIEKKDDWWFKDEFNAGNKDLLKKNESEQEKAYFYLTKERDVQFLVHFTPVRNIRSILRKGILTRSQIMEQGIEASFPDKERFDKELSYSSFSISFPNYKILSTKMLKETPNWEYALLLIDPRIILDLPLELISYLPYNAAKKSLGDIKKYIGLENLKNLFSDKIQVNGETIYRNQLGIPDEYTTNPQAEVFIGTNIDPKYITAIVVNSDELQEKLFFELRFFKFQTPVKTNKNLFKPRCDYRKW